MDDNVDKHGPGLKFPPPLLVLGIIGCTYLVDSALRLPIVSGDELWLAGIAIIVLAFLFVVVALLHFHKAKTQVEPWRPTTSIIQQGVFRYSRNPIYLAFCIATIGIGLVSNSWWIVMSTLPLACLLQQLVIRREEDYLENKFGDEYLDYKRRVRRWL